ncbi:glycosyltransferase [Flavobacterium sediminilitoris]|uniref:Glycosyltransferase n=1 Tax=Flavobacterium sediminilitoris TaxID=2024526 RepID=A0ABY4HT47_9FLAO|nr:MULTISPECIES: glycosyltransferase [Flavobacterium]UOX34939.1 glycosyltransferase [Flavobacterium sediminilitoris]
MVYLYGLILNITILVVVHVVEALGGGVYTYFKDLTSHFSKEDDIKTIIFFSKNRKEIDPKNLELITNQNVELVEVDMCRKLNPLQDYKSILKLRKLLKKYNPDIVHLHSSKASVLGRIAALNIVSKERVFYTPHGYSFLSKEFSNSKKKVFYFIEKYIQRIFGGITLACGDTEYEIAQKIGKSVLVRNGIIVDKLSAFKKPIKNNVLTIGIIGRISFQKNPDLFNTIALRFSKYNFIWIGDGELKSQLTATNITITGWSLDQVEVMSRLNSIDVYLQTSLWEGLPIALLEAMALEKPLVATNIIGNKDIVVHNENGYLFNCIEELDIQFKKLEDERTRNEMGANGLKRCKALFNTTTNFNQMKSIYLNTISNA